jgi:carbonic anhydrase
MFFNCEVNSNIKAINYNSDFTGLCDPQAPPTIKSPVDIEYYNSNGHMAFPGNPKIVLDRTVYRRVNAKKFDFVPKNDKGVCPENPCSNLAYHELEMDINNIGTAYVKLYNQTYEYKPYALRLHVYSEHTLEGMKMDMEIQIMHEYPLPQIPTGLSKKVGLAVLFSVARNKHSSFVEDFIEEVDNITDESERYAFSKTKSLDLNQFFNFWEPFYHYKGSGTSPSEYCDEVDWFVMKKVENMSQEQLRRILLILAKNSYPDGNAKYVEKIPTKTPFQVNYCPNVEPDEDE